jgi:hypothetical protein
VNRTRTLEGSKKAKNANFGQKSNIVEYPYHGQNSKDTENCIWVYSSTGP